MRLMRVGEPGMERPVLLGANGVHRDLSGVTGDIDGQFLSDGGLDRVRQALERGDLPEIDVAGQRIGAPVARPSVVLCIGMNYAAHAAESGSPPPDVPVMFYKAPNTVVGPDDDVLIPRGSAKTDWEVELAVIIGRRARYLDSPAQALRFVAGYAISNDVSERGFQLESSGGQWSKGKSCETFNPLGPWLVTAEEIADPQSLGLRSWVNGDPRQDSTTADMVFSVAELIWQLSQVTVLEPGDVLNTGTPAGVALSGRFAYLSPGDVVRLRIDGLGSQTQRLRSA
ncbi:MAG TPA: fumarylacetoacetate hydrolase family protein [Jatrophihabitans sp.]|jgi:2-keto-4-pentenoate hydratase/2-oxohepta-3-ene-1,7-dioic acid hydratase in catechol pathway|uniref:fumarylacetoacetate hydrolase family protein n=1 Tax=Jatrophihabitans sp. TaxID=1932789 RepID=UPI002F1073B7